MLFAVTCLDKPDSGHIRQENRPAHVDFLKAAGDTVRLAGPVFSDDQERMIGSLLVIEAEDRAALGAWLEQDPYAKAGLFDTVTVRPFKWVLPQQAG